MIIDAHVHLWNAQHGKVNGKPVVSLGGGRSDFGGEIKQMLPPYMIDGKNTVEYLLANMDYTGVNGAVVTQEYIDGNQDEYLRQVSSLYSDRIKVCSLYEENSNYSLEGFDGIKICAGRLQKESLIDTLPVFKEAEKKNKFVSIDLYEGEKQVLELQEIINQCPEVRIAIGHFGMVTKEGFLSQIALAKNKNVYIESGGITWLFHKEFYPYPSAIEAIIQAAEVCGIDKLMFGSDYPRTMTAITYSMAFDFIIKSERLNEEEKRKFLGDTACKFYGFNPQPNIVRIKNMVED